MVYWWPSENRGNGQTFR